ncbi:hypothetical protein [Mesobacillus subterraneus]|uniref:Uncharacterized protein n=1 Tax=Mesobacillus subterraneus TaxID=285983 RepID=A0A3R9KYZ7_9BACI|nr:hypothetical protein [Mesobacillus subterraneus]RSD29239.1 hypothetical protein EJA10_00885 [Mesobacillus subterraneus]
MSPGKLIFKIEEYISTHTRELLSVKDHKKLSRLLFKSDIPLSSHLHQFKIDPSEYLTGVQCPFCSQYAMERYSGTWNCTVYGHTAKDAHFQAVDDYLILISDTITNRQFREFLHLHSPKLATKLMANMNLNCEGTSRKSCFYTQH